MDNTCSVCRIYLLVRVQDLYMDYTCSVCRYNVEYVCFVFNYICTHMSLCVYCRIYLLVRV